MAKQQPNVKPHLPSTGNLPSVADLPSVGAMTEGDVPVVKDTPVPVKQTLDGKLCTCMVEAPMLQLEGTGFVKRRIEVKLTTEQAMALKGLKLGLEAHDATLRDGSRVKHTSDAIRWVLENLV